MGVYVYPHENKSQTTRFQGIRRKHDTAILGFNGASNGFLTLKMPRKPVSENVVCVCDLLNILANFSILFCIQANSVDPDQTSRGAV